MQTGHQAEVEKGKPEEGSLLALGASLGRGRNPLFLGKAGNVISCNIWYYIRKTHLEILCCRRVLVGWNPSLFQVLWCEHLHHFLGKTAGPDGFPNDTAQPNDPLRVLHEELVSLPRGLIQPLFWPPRLFSATWWGLSLIFSIFILQPVRLIFSFSLAEGNPSSS